MDHERTRVCPVELADVLDSKIRRWLQNPRKILSPFVGEGMTVLDIGCGPGFYSIELARMVGSAGRVIAADLQEGMLRKLEAKIRGTALAERVRLVKCEAAGINVPEKVDFGLAFWMVHEVPDQARFFRELRAVIKEKGRLLVIEPKLFHVSRRDFASTIGLAGEAGFAARPGPRLLLSWSAVLENAA
jgi:ubiquinone/menaquinone biosynthesis C-methylase UbiE